MQNSHPLNQLLCHFPFVDIIMKGTSGKDKNRFLLHQQRLSTKENARVLRAPGFYRLTLTRARFNQQPRYHCKLRLK